MDKLKEIFGLLGLKYRFEGAVVDKFEEQDKRLYVLEENRKLKDPTIVGLQQQIAELRLMLATMQREMRGKS